jgi:ABC-type multidrug transport system fused ATPase/permease subunit
MFPSNKQLSKKYFPILDRIFGFSKTAKIMEIDFQKPWWVPIAKHTLKLSLFAVAESLLNIFNALLPLFLTILLVSRQLQNVVYFSIIWAVLLVLSNISFYLLCKVESEIVQSVQYQATRFFLTVDPIFHTTRSSGQIIAKVNRGSESFETFIDLTTRDILGVLVSLITIIVTLFKFNSGLALSGLFYLAIISLVSIVVKIMTVKITVTQWISDEDDAKDINIETLREVNHIRSSFATKEQDKNLQAKNLKLMSTMATSWYSHITSDNFTQLLYQISVVLLAGQILNLITSSQLSTEIGISLLLSYISGTANLLRIGRNVEKLLDRISRISDLFDFIRSFGKQTYPVLERENTPEPNGSTPR